MRVTRRVAMLLVIAVAAAAQSPQNSLTDTRLTVHTLLREDLFAGFMQNDMVRFERGEKNLEALLKARPNNQAELLAWKGSALVYRAVLDLEAKNTSGYDQKMKSAFDLYTEARSLQPRNGGVLAPMGGGLVFFGDRVADKDKARVWDLGYQAFSGLWKGQEANLDSFPVHIKGELLAGLAQSAQRTGRTQEVSLYVDRIISGMPGTPYERMAQKWKKNPASAANSSMTCMTCHEPGRLEARLAALPKSSTN